MLHHQGGLQPAVEHVHPAVRQTYGRVAHLCSTEGDLSGPESAVERGVLRGDPGVAREQPPLAVARGSGEAHHEELHHEVDSEPDVK